MNQSTVCRSEEVLRLVIFFFLFINLLSFLNIRCSHLILRITNLSYTTSDKINFVIEF